MANELNVTSSYSLPSVYLATNVVVAELGEDTPVAITKLPNVAKVVNDYPISIVSSIT